MTTAIKSPFNKKKWLKRHLELITDLKKNGHIYSMIIKILKDNHNMPFDLEESLLSRYLKEFAEDESTTLKTKTALTNKIDRQRERITQQNNEIQNLKRRLERMEKKINKLESIIG